MAVPERFEVGVTKASLGFSAAHFLTLPGHICERLHGHNYRVGVRLAAPVDPATGFVVDFAVLKRALHDLTAGMDHRILIPARNGALAIHEETDRVVVDYTRPGWLVVPREHACLLPVEHTTAELLAGYCGREVRAALEAAGVTAIQSFELELEESAGQSAVYRADG